MDLLNLKLVDAVISNDEFEQIENSLNLTNLIDKIKFEDELHIHQDSKPVIANEIALKIEQLINNNC